MPHSPGYVERLEENEGFLLAQCSDMQGQLAEAVSIIHALTGKSRQQINETIAKRRAEKKCKPPTTTDQPSS